MDTLTHALSGVLVCRSLSPPARFDARLTLVGFFSSAFPDIDYLITWVDPLVYLNLHQGWTHSVILLPLWALLVSAILWPFIGKALAARKLYVLCAAGITIHILGDVITSYGTQVFAPLSTRRLALDYTFVIDPYLSALIVLAIVTSAVKKSRRLAAVGLAMLACYVGLQGLLHQRAIDLAGQTADEPAVVHALPQPFSPCNWKLVAQRGESYEQTYVTFCDSLPSPLAFYPKTWPLSTAIAAYHAPSAAPWTRHFRYGDESLDRMIVHEGWDHPLFRGFREFAELPALLGVEKTTDETCVWFTDLRFTYPALPPAFRYGMCRGAKHDEWRLYRLRLFPLNQRQALSVE
ncbi:MAG: metal-dependent hydrolase [Gammaproteobacteria bacterium]